MNGQLKTEHRYQGQLATIVAAESKQRENTLSLQLQVSVTVLWIFGFAYSRLIIVTSRQPVQLHGLA